MSYDCEIDFPQEFESKYPPFFRILGEEGNKVDTCLYKIEISLGIVDRMLFSYGWMFYKEGRYYISFSQNDHAPFLPWFDFNALVGYSNPLELILEEENYRIEVEKLGIYHVNDVNEVHVFKIHEGFNYFGNRMDMVILASPKKGFLGSYAVDETTIPPVIAIKAGSLYEEYIDYSKFEFRNLQ